MPPRNNTRNVEVVLSHAAVSGFRWTTCPPTPSGVWRNCKLSQAGNYTTMFFVVAAVCFIVQVLLHIRTEKGMGYPPAMAASDKYHGVAKFNVATGKQHKGVRDPTDWDTASAGHSRLRAVYKTRACVVSEAAGLPTAPAVAVSERCSTSRSFQSFWRQARGVTFVSRYISVRPWRLVSMMNT